MDALRGSQGGLGVPQVSFLHMGLVSQGGKEAGAPGRERALPCGPQALPPHRPRGRLAPGEGSRTGHQGPRRGRGEGGASWSSVPFAFWGREGGRSPG